MKLGYACLNTELSKIGIRTNRGMIKKTFTEQGLGYVSDLALQNIKDLEKIFYWNEKNNIKFFRISSDLFPWFSEYDLKQLKDYNQISEILHMTGDFALSNDIRFGFHPGHFNILCSPKDNVVNSTINELNKHGEILDLMGASRTPYYKINIHIGGAYGDKESALNRFIENFHKLDLSVKTRLTIENDDKINMYTVEDLLPVAKKLGVPIVFDFHHWLCNKGKLSLKESLELSLGTWGSSITPATHFSSSKLLFEDTNSKPVSHSDFVHTQIPTFGLEFDIMLETKMKEQSLLRYREEKEKLEHFKY